MFKSIFPSIEAAMSMEPEELAPFVLKHLKQIGKINRYNYTLGTSLEMIEYAGKHLEDFKKRLMEAFIWLEREMFIAPQPGESGDWRFITRRGESIFEEEDFKAYVKESLLSSRTLNPLISRKVKPLFARGDYDTAIFQAFKIVEIKVRKSGGYSDEDFGINLMRKAFNPNNGELTNKQNIQAEKQAMMELFSGAIGLFKNPTSHRDVGNLSPEWVADVIRFANALLGML